VSPTAISLACLVTALYATPTAKALGPARRTSHLMRLPGAASPMVPAANDFTYQGGPLISRSSVDGYVSNYRLIARFPDGIPFRFSYVTAGLFAGTLSVEIVPNVMPKPYEFRNGLLTGRIPRRDIFADIPVMTYLLSGQPVCTNVPAVYSIVRNWLCSFADLTSKSAEGTLPNCDMLSFGLAFQPVLAKVGTMVEEPPLPKLCPPEADPVNETCDLSESGAGP